MMSHKPTESTSRTVPTAVKRVNALAVASFVLSLATVGIGLYSLSLLNAAANTPSPHSPTIYTVPSNVYWASLGISILAAIIGGVALSQSKQHPHDKTLTGFAQGGLAIGIVSILFLICGGSFLGLAISVCGNGC